MPINNELLSKIFSAHIALAKQGVSTDLAYTMYYIKYAVNCGFSYEKYLLTEDKPVSKNIYNHFKVKHLIGA